MTTQAANEPQQRVGADIQSDSPANSPSVTFHSLTFSDGTTIELDPTDVIVFVGPNNAGKSLALRELEDFIRDKHVAKVFSSVHSKVVGSANAFDAFVRRHAKVTNRGNSWRVSGYRFSLSLSTLRLTKYWPGHFADFSPLFCLRVSTETRITDSDPVDAIDVLEQPVSNPLHMLLDDELEFRLSSYFRRAFAEDLIVFHGGGSKLPLLVGQRLRPQEGEDRVSADYCRRLIASTVPLNSQGDGMRSFASVILHLLAPITPTILLLDEPEAFLHPPQARLLGEIIAAERSDRTQLFVATHSPDALHGLMNVASERLRVLRIQRDGNTNRVKELDKTLVRKISIDPLMKYSSVMSGLFHERVVVCESDADCMFYSSMLDLPEVHGERHPDVLFVHASGKDRIVTLAKTLVALGVPVDIIADIDALRDSTSFGSIVESLGADPTMVLRLAEAVKRAIEEHKPWLNAGEIKKGISKVLEEVPATGGFPQSLRSKIEALFRKASPWDAVKGAGESAIPSGEATKQFQILLSLCKQTGLWIVPVGELEGFCKSVGGHGPRWVQRVIEERNLGTDPDLERARVFVRELWERTYIRADGDAPHQAALASALPPEQSARTQ